MVARRILFAFVYLAVLACGVWLSGLSHGIVMRMEGGAMATGLLVTLFIVFILFSALPFVPGAEIGFGLLMALGGGGAAIVYSGMIIALTMAFVMGRFVPARWLVSLFAALGLDRARKLVETPREMSMDERARFISENAPARWVPFLLRHRHVALAVLLNTPGNVMLGGGGGIAFAAGASRIFSTGGFVLTILLAVAPLPLAFLLFGSGGLVVRA